MNINNINYPKKMLNYLEFGAPKLGTLSIISIFVGPFSRNMPGSHAMPQTPPSIHRHFGCPVSDPHWVLQWSFQILVGPARMKKSLHHHLRNVWKFHQHVDV